MGLVSSHAGIIYLGFAILQIVPLIVIAGALISIAQSLRKKDK